MAAICGIINTNLSKYSNDELKQRLIKSLSPYKIDKIDSLIDSNFIFVCGQQFITPQDCYSNSPYLDNDNHIAYTADCMIDNREELFALIYPDSNDLIKDKISDQELLYKAYLKWGVKLGDKVCGIFSLAIYHTDTGIFHLFTDHTSTRTVHYANIDGIIYFGTILESIKCVLNKKATINEEWISFAQALPNPDMIYKPDLSPYNDIYTVEAGHYITIKNNQISRHSYYNPAKTKLRLKFKTDEEYKNYFVKLLDRCVGDVLRSKANTGCTLSSGLDSTTIASIAARHLAKENKELHSYTSVPLKDYINQAQKDSYFIEDESFGPKILNKYYPNIKVNLIDCKGKTAFTDIKRTVKLTELPLKSLVNYTWMSEIYDLASKNDCKVMLKGQYGNSTISNGKILSRVYQELCRFKFKSAINQSRAFAIAHKVPKKYYIKTFLKIYKEKFILDISAMDKFYLRKDLIKKYNVKSIIKHNFQKEGGSYMDSRKQFEKYVYDTRILQHLGLFDTHLSLIYGVVIRDPAKDKRILDFVFNAPLSCFVNNGTERRMIRDYMRGIVPDEILDIDNKRGLQSSDFVYRINQVLNTDLKPNIIKAITNPMLTSYFDVDKLNKLKYRVENSKELERDEIQDILCICSLSEFLLM